MTPLLVIRPQPGCGATVRAARLLGLDAEAHPLFAVGPLAWSPPGDDSFDALLIGSANALRHGGPALAAWQGRPAYAVGASTARAARDAGLEVVATGQGGLQAMLARIAPAHRRLLRLAGRERVQLDPPPGITLAECVVYASEPCPASPELAARLGDASLVLLHSAEAARHFAGECDRLGIARHHLSIAALGPRIAAAAGTGWARLAAAAAPSDQALLALAQRMCQSAVGSDPG